MATKLHQTPATVPIQGGIQSLFWNPDGSERQVYGVNLSDWGRIAFCLVTLYSLLGFFYAGLINIAIEIRQEDWLLLADDHYGPFDRADRFLLDSSGNFISALDLPEDSTLVPREEIHRKYNRPDGCVSASRGTPAVDVLVCDEDGKKAYGRWIVNPWIADLARSTTSGYNNPACSYSTPTTTILRTDGGLLGSGTCTNGVSVVAAAPSTAPAPAR